MKELLNNKNFINNQNYVLSEKLVNNTKKGMNITKGKGVYKENLIGFNFRLKIQKIEISKIKGEDNKLKYQILGFDLLMILGFSLDYIKNGFQIEFIFIAIFLIVFTVPWFINFNKKDNYRFFRDNNYLIIYRK